MKPVEFPRILRFFRIFYFNSGPDREHVAGANGNSFLSGFDQPLAGNDYMRTEIIREPVIPAVAVADKVPGRTAP
jgi:hypothetical protein